jgi:hypothetical protein
MKAVVFVPRSPWPTWSGMDIRAHTMINHLRPLCSHVTLASLYTAEDPAPPGVSSVACFDSDSGRSMYRKSSWISPAYARGEWLWSKSVDEVGAWFAALVERLSPDLLVIHQSRYAWLARDLADSGCMRVLDAPEPQSVADRLWGRVAGAIGDFPVDIAAIPQPALDRLSRCEVGASIDPSEIEGFGLFDRVLLMSEAEARHVGRLVGDRKACWLPQVMDAVQVKPTYDGPAIYLMAANPHNVAGFAWFMREVLPLVLAAAPDFQLLVAGEGTACVKPPTTDAVRPVGRVRDLGSDLYANACLAVCPVFSGTGQPVKLLEALAYRVPVVAVGPAAARAGLHPGRGGLVGEDALSFADAVVKLWRDRRLARRMGDAGAKWLLETHKVNPLAAALAGLNGMPPL